nr:MAG TPA: hypothetical protein [Caudoviricetes sp.]
MPHAHPGVVRTRRVPRNHPRGCLQTPRGVFCTRGVSETTPGVVGKNRVQRCIFLVWPSA